MCDVFVINIKLLNNIVYIHVKYLKAKGRMRYRFHCTVQQLQKRGVIQRKGLKRSNTTFIEVNVLCILKFDYL